MAALHKQDQNGLGWVALPKITFLLSEEGGKATLLTFSLFGAGLVLTLGLDRVALVVQQRRGRRRRRCGRGRQEVVRVRRHRELAVVRREGGGRGREAEGRWQRRGNG